MRKISLLIAFVAIWATPEYTKADILYEEYFTDSTLTLNWFPGWMFAGCYDSIIPVAYPDNPSEDGWIGRLMNEYAMTATSLAGTDSLKDYCIEANIYTKVTDGGGGWYGIVARTDTADGTNFYYYLLMCDFDYEKRMRLSHSERALPHVLREWSADEIPGGVPEQSSWHKLRLKITGEQTVDQEIWAFFDNVLLPGCPYSDPDPIPGTTGNTGFFGVFVLRSPGVTDTTLCDDIRVSTGIMDDVTIDSIISPPNTVPPDSPVIPEVVVMNVGDYNEIFEVICRIDSSGIEIYQDTVSMNLLEPDSSHQVSFAPWTPHGEDIFYQVFFWTTLAYDDNLNNDTLFKEVLSTSVGIHEYTDKINTHKVVHLYHISPNPFKQATEIEYSLPVDCWVKLEIYNVLGERVVTLMNQVQKAGHHRIQWETKLTSGIYFLRIEAAEFSKIQKMVITK